MDQKQQINGSQSYHFTYDGAYEPIYDTAYNTSFVFYDEEGLEEEGEYSGYSDYGETALISQLSSKPKVLKKKKRIAQ